MFVLGITALVAIGAFAQQGQSGPEKPILEQLGKLRSMPDEERSLATRALAMQIRSLPAGPRKVGIAESLANLSTEGDFGRQTLQEVATTLANALKESPAADLKGEPAPVYVHLAQLERYEGMKVDLASPAYTMAIERVIALENERAKADFTLKDMQGHTWTRSALKGKVVLVNFWATWCPPCRKEMPDLDALYKRFRDNGLVVLAISDEKPETVQKFLQTKPVDYPVLIDSGRQVNALYKVDSIPKSFVYNREGKLVAQSIDMRTRAQFLEMLSRAGLR